MTRRKKAKRFKMFHVKQFSVGAAVDATLEINYSGSNLE